MLLHIIDVTHPNALEQAKAVMETLDEIHAEHIPVINVLNKIDLLENRDTTQKLLPDFPEAVAISAVSGEGVDSLMARIDEFLYQTFVPISVKVPYTQGQLLSFFHENGQVDTIQYEEKVVHMKGRLPVRFLARYQEFLKEMQ